LLDAGEFAGAYYLAGYAVECALKACIARKTQQYEFPDWQKVRESYTHDPDKLLKMAELSDALATARQKKPKLDVSWALVRRWSVDARYLGPRRSAKREAVDLYTAIADAENGVLRWLKRRW